MDTDNITIFEKDLEAAQHICAAITDAEKRNKAVASVIAARIAAGYFDNEKYDIDVQTGLYNIASIVEQYEISDLYINGNFIDTIVYFSEDEMGVPKVHFDTGILPVAYMFIKLSPDLKQASVTGFIYPEEVNKNNADGNVYVVKPDELSNFYNIEIRLKQQLDTADINSAQIYEFLDGTLGIKDTVDLLKILTKSKQGRIKLIRAVKAQSAFNFVSMPEQTNATEELSAVDSTVSEVKDGQAEDSDEDLTDEDLDSLFDIPEEAEESDTNSEITTSYSTEVTPSGADVIESLDNENNENKENNETENKDDQIETLFTGEQEGIPVPNNKNKSFALIFIVLTILICGGIAFMIMHNKSADNELTSTPPIESENSQSSDINAETSQPQEDAMPVETVEGTQPTANKEESAAVSIPAIERNLDASVLVSNLKIDWEVPEAYASNTGAKRYFVKLGKIIQLNLKTELLLLNKPPLSDRITVELKYNKGSGRFEVEGIKMSSGEKTVDDAILQTVNTALAGAAGAAPPSFAKLQGNPILIIHL